MVLHDLLSVFVLNKIRSICCLFQSLSDVALDDYSLEKADSVTKSILADIYPESNSPPLSSIRLADEFIRICEFAPTLNYKCKILTTSDLMEYHTSFQPTNECINLK